MRAEVSGTDTVIWAHVTLALAEVQALRGRAGEALTLIESALEVLERQDASDHWTHAVADSIHGACLVRLGLGDEGVRRLREAAERLDADPSSSPRARRDAERRLAAATAGVGD